MNNSWIHFADDFSDIGGYELGQVTDFITALIVTGEVDISFDVNELTFCIAGMPVLYMVILNKVPDIYIRPDILEERFGADMSRDFLDSLSPYIDKSRCRLPLYDYKGAYFLDIKLALNGADEISDALAQLAVKFKSD